jgi:hypothetical protein
MTHHTTSDQTIDKTMTSFNSDSSFWICNSAATGHTCNDKSSFSGNPVPSIYEVKTANGIDSSSLMGTVIPGIIL